ncbi:hypothetical protein PM082_021123 [Marasmius tenuissimus]|nr:hypothetical protein PM082_021123 [Marasmius tenuissimus]
MSTIPLSESLLGKPTHPPERFESLLRGPVSKADRAEVMNYLRDTERNYRNGQVEINKYKAMISMLESKREAMKKEMEKYRTLLSPVHRLPSELLSRIFEDCCEYNFLDLTMPPASSLSMVCGRWREIALSSPGLWSSICITGHHRVVHEEVTDEEVTFEEEILRGNSLVNRLRLCLERSVPAPLQLDITILDNSSHYRSKQSVLSNIIMRLLAEHSERWEVLNYQGSDFFASSAAGESNFPLLRRLRLGIGQGRSDNGDPTLPLDRFLSCAALTSVYTDAVDTDGRLQLPWTNIRVLSLEWCSQASVTMVLASCTALEELTLGNIYNDTETSDDRTVTLDTIRTLTISHPYPDSIPNVQHFIFPRLSTININYAEVKPIHLQELIQRSSCSITSLRLAGPRLTDSQLSSLLRLMPELRSLDIGTSEEGYPIVSPRVLERLTVNPIERHQVFLPRLVDLEINLFGEHVDEQTLINALTSRLIQIPSRSSPVRVDRLQSVDIQFFWDFEIPPDAFPSLQYLGEFGLKLTISHRICN